MPQFLPKDAKDLLWKMLTVDPTQRITMAEIKSHPWFLSNSLHVATSLPMVPEIGGPISPDDIDEEIMRSVASLGMGEESEVRDVLTSLTPNMTQAYYHLLLVRKHKPPESFMDQHRKKHLSRSRGNSAPNLTPLIISPPPPIQIQSQSTNVSPATTPVMSPRLSPRFQDLNRNRRNSTASPPITIAATVSRFHRLKMEEINGSPEMTPGSPIIGSNPKKSWFSNFFQKAGEREGEDPDPVQPLGISTMRSLPEIVQQLEDAMRSLNLSWEMASSNIFKVKSDAPHVRIIIDITSTGTGAHFINFTPGDGTAADYQKVVEGIQREMSL
eukprot:TRINITY_DN4662_c0_g1_i2.p1 TRINITY_DN4662_c0_g1~~TRINITY_DN4662_c0_g1_i2.p1  ORF type:complete len:328 (-),score=91.79 TRINITY_DN4662_c0_g1_i2:95-1078(-)